MSLVSVEEMYSHTFSEDKVTERMRWLTGMDAGNMVDPAFHMYEGTADNSNLFVNTFATENLLDKQELWAGATKSPQGHFITFVACLDAFRNDWKFVEEQGYDEVEESLKRRLLTMRRDYNIKRVHTMACGTARALGKCIVAKVKQKSFGFKKKPKVKLRIFPIFDWEIEWDQETGDPVMYNPMGTVGLLWHRFHISPKDAVMYIHKVDPFGNGYQGIPEIYTIYNQLRWLANIEHGWAEAMDSRGISMLQFKIPGYHPEMYEKYRKAYGDPSDYNVVFTPEDIEVDSIAGVSSQFNLDQTLEAFTKETSAASGMAASRIDGTQRGQVSGTQNDTDNYYSILNGIQEEFEGNLIELFEMLDNTLIGSFDISWEVEQKLDAGAKAQIMATNMATLQQGLDFFTYNKGLEMLQLPKIGPEGDEIASIFIFNQQKEAGMVMDVNEQAALETAKSEEPKPKGGDEKSSKSKQASVRKKDVKKPPKKFDEEKRGGDRSKNNTEVQQCKARLASGRRCGRWTSNPSGYCYMHEGGKRGGNWGSKDYQKQAARKQKVAKAKRARWKGDSYYVINRELKSEFGSGFSFTTLKDIDTEITAKKTAMVSDEIHNVIKEHPNWSRNKVIAHAYKKVEEEGYDETEEEPDNSN